jgi:hypothetical protein
MGGTIVLQPGSPGYIVNEPGLLLRVHGTRLVSGVGGQKATIIGGQDLRKYIISTDGSIHDVEISHIKVDGRVDVPGWRQYRNCVADVAVWGNISLLGDRAYVHDSESISAVCGSALQLRGSNQRILNNYIAWNGRDRFSGETGDRWSDGITLLSCYGGEVAYNQLVDNTDIDIVSGGGNCWVHHNSIWHGGKYAFAGIQLGWFQEGQGNHAGSVYEHNTVTNTSNKLGAGILIGNRPWGSPWVTGGTVRNNTIDGAVINLLAEGATNVTIQGNSMSSPRAGHPGPGGCYVEPGWNFAGKDVSGSIQGGIETFTFNQSLCGPARLYGGGRLYSGQTMISAMVGSGCTTKATGTLCCGEIPTGT